MSHKGKRLLSAIIVVLGICVLVASILAVENLADMDNMTKILVVLTGILIFVASFVAAVVLDRQAGLYECPNCQHRFLPTIAAYLSGMRSPTKRYLKCPECGERSYCKRKL